MRAGTEPTLDTDRYDEIREVVRWEKMALQLTDKDEGLLVFNNFTCGWGEEVRELVGQAMEAMVEPDGKVHDGGCLHSGKPNMIICQGKGLKEVEGGEARLASGLYFKRCDGCFKNLKG